MLFPSCECGIVPIINRFLEKFLVTAVLSCDCTCYQSHCSLCDLFCLWQLIPRRLLRALGSIVVAVILGIFLGFFWQEPIQRKSFGLSWARFFGWSPKKSFQVFVQAIDEFLIRDAIWYIWLSLSMIQVYVQLRFLTSISATPLFLPSCSWCFWLSSFAL